MVLLIAGASHAGKTALAQRLLEKYKYPYISMDHLKMGLIRSENTTLTPWSDDVALTAYLWPIVREIIKTAIENQQNLIVEGCYIPFDWVKDFPDEYRQHIRYRCLIMSESYIRDHYGDIQAYANAIEKRPDDSDCTMESLLHDHAENLRMCRRYGVDYVWIEDTYPVDALTQIFEPMPRHSFLADAQSDM